jgi:hypothetical protein
LHGSVQEYAAQEISQIDTAKVKKNRFRMETDYSSIIYHKYPEETTRLSVMQETISSINPQPLCRSPCWIMSMNSGSMSILTCRSFGMLRVAWE